MEEIKEKPTFKIPKEVLNWFLMNGSIFDNGTKYAFIPQWYEIVDEEKSLVKMHTLGDLPKHLEDNVKGMYGVKIVDGKLVENKIK